MDWIIANFNLIANVCILWGVVLLFVLLKILVKVLPAGRAVSILSKFI